MGLDCNAFQNLRHRVLTSSAYACCVSVGQRSPHKIAFRTLGELLPRRISRVTKLRSSKLADTLIQFLTERQLEDAAPPSPDESASPVFSFQRARRCHLRQR